jgi:biopolymer transport protein ExbD
MKKKRRQKKSMITVPVASMGDIAFLLIIFFMVASRISQDKRIESASSLDSEELKESKIMVLIDDKGISYVNGQRQDSVKMVQAEVQEMLDRRDATNVLQRTVMFKCDHSVRKIVFEPVIEAIVEAGGILAAVGDLGDPEARTEE